MNTDKNKQDVVTAFKDMLDSLAYNGYAEHLAENDPILYKYEFENFMNIYCF